MMYWLGIGLALLVAYVIIVIDEKVNNERK
jgi:hypothetical protein